jgi:hypothetical protein
VNIPKKIPASPSSKKIRTGKEKKNANSIENEVFFFFLEKDITYIHSTQPTHTELSHNPNNSPHPSKVHA